MGKCALLAVANGPNAAQRMYDASAMQKRVCKFAVRRVHLCVWPLSPFGNIEVDSLYTFDISPPEYM